ncbi:hypothetical protein ACRQ5Q_33440 [Bradyrhizobium sp. PMVTL-01]|uniref:hypothetical protein n=1 Tax=Bradyrhizobium sp. PMVTL-01 TaxID=3434999 RepID=UPI003F6F1BEB
MSSIDIAPQAALKPKLLKKALGQWRLLVCILAPAIVLLSPIPAGLTLEAWRQFVQPSWDSFCGHTTSRSSSLRL